MFFRFPLKPVEDYSHHNLAVLASEAYRPVVWAFATWTTVEQIEIYLRVNKEKLACSQWQAHFPSPATISKHCEFERQSKSC